MLKFSRGGSGFAFLCSKRIVFKTCSISFSLLNHVYTFSFSTKIITGFGLDLIFVDNSE